MLNCCLTLLPQVIDSCRSAAGQAEFFNLMSTCWNSNLSFSPTVEHLNHLGKQLYTQRSPFYNVLRTHYGLFGLPLEIGQFKRTNSEKPAVSEYDELQLTEVEHSTWALYGKQTRITNEKKEKGKKMTSGHFLSFFFLFIGYSSICIITE